MGIRGIDISNYQASMDVERVVRENNIDFVIVQSNDGTLRNANFRSQINAARRGGAMVAAYLYQRPNWIDTVNTFKSIVTNDIPVIVDVEDGSGGVDVTWNIHRELWNSGYHTPALYLPKWYWDRIGQPSLAGLPGIWKSWYPNTIPDTYDNHLAKVPNSVWNGHGGSPIVILQFSGTGRLSGYGANVDLNYYPGDREDFANLLGQEEDMPSAEEIAAAVWNYKMRAYSGPRDENGKYPEAETSAGNALLSNWSQTFFATGEYGPSLASGLGEAIERLVDIKTKLDAGQQVELPSKDEFIAAIIDAVESAVQEKVRVVGSLSIEHNDNS
jgi:hypothetical protein